MSHPLDNMGLFGRLPRELRNEIWQHFSLHERSSPPPQDGMAILRTCKQIHEEVALQVYDKTPIIIKISPIFRRSAWFRTEVDQELMWNYEDGSEAFANIPFFRFKGIKVEIEAPRCQDQGQLICLFHKSLELSKILSRQEHLPNLQISLVNTEVGSWCTTIKEKFAAPDGRYHRVETFVPQRSMCLVESRSGSLRHSLHHDYDYATILRAFYRLHNVHTAYVTVPEKLRPYLGRSGLLEGFAWPESEALWSDECVQRHLDTTYVQFEDLLDVIQGQTAGMMRLRRFSKWFADRQGKIPSYLPELRRIYNSDVDHEIDYNKIQRRYLWMKSLNPMSRKIRMQMAQTEAFVLRPTFKTESAEKTSSLLELADGWNAQEWYEYYQFGLAGLDCDSLPRIRLPRVEYEATDEEKKDFVSLFGERKIKIDVAEKLEDLGLAGKEVLPSSRSLTLSVTAKKSRKISVCPDEQ